MQRKPQFQLKRGTLVLQFLRAKAFPSKSHHRWDIKCSMELHQI